MRVFLTGKNGQVGWALHRKLASLGEVIAFDRAELDLTDVDKLRAKLREVKPDIIVNAAAYTAVDQAEREPELAMAINGIAPGVMAEEAKKLGALLVHYSTDYVYGGDKQTPWLETDATGPVNLYGKSKLAGDEVVQAVGGEHIILRTSWVYGNRGKNFYLTIKRLLAERDELSIVADQIGTPTWSQTIADVSQQIIIKRRDDKRDATSGVYHLTSLGQTSWHGFAVEIAQGLQINKTIKPILSDQYPTPAKRPAYSVMSCDKLTRTFGIQLPEWQDGLSACIEKG